ncbi:hypothetical protein V6N12_025661 [Hibiscus sabdariffa]|uniref:Uncharacterized protein n=1 Tax=Hibiscus sabdariffa TaxID=183260 RepID=A0ABR2AWB1_9ROSI
MIPYMLRSGAVQRMETPKEVQRRLMNETCTFRKWVGVKLWYMCFFYGSGAQERFCHNANNNEKGIYLVEAVPKS